MMRSILHVGLLTALLPLIAPGPARAVTVVFTGTRDNVNVLNPPGTGRCAPLNTVEIGPGRLSSSGTSNFGGFVSTQSHCIPGAPSAATPVQPVTSGIFSYLFDAGDTLFGTYAGQAIFDAGVITGAEDLTVTGGTGRFAEATGTILSRGRLSFAPNPSGQGVVGVFSGTVNGTLNLANPLPEPATWAMMIAGFGLIGSRLRARRMVLTGMVNGPDGLGRVGAASGRGSRNQLRALHPCRGSVRS
jgi:hypothetical protein